jgi:N-acetylneuraminic acid mutarotase
MGDKFDYFQLSALIISFTDKIRKKMEKIILNLPIISLCFLSLVIIHCAHNRPPGEITINISRTLVESKDSVIVKASALDPDGDSLIYKWSATGGSFNTTVKDSVIWIAPEVNELAEETLTVKVFDIHNDFLMANVTLTVIPEGGIWMTKAPMPTPRWGNVVVAVDGKVYVIGGYIDLDTTSIPTGIVEEYDPETDTWVQKRPMPTPRGNMGAVVIGKKIYVIGGHDKSGPTGVNEVYDVLTDIWEYKAPMPTPRSGLALVEVNGLVYAIGGYNYGILGINECYDPVHDLWTPRSEMPTPRMYLGAVSYKGKVYAIGGYGVSFLVTNEVYDPKSDTWVSKSPMQWFRDGLAVVVCNGKIYALGGRTMLPGEDTDINEAYDPDTDTWVYKRNMPTSRYMFGAAVVGGKIYAIGGNHSWYGTNKNEVYYSP